MDYLLLGRVEKLAALLGFVRPWVTVSCSGTEILTATGWQLMTGDPQPAGPLQGRQANGDMDPAPLVIIAFGVIALGLGLSFLPKAKIAAAALLIGGLGGAGMTYYSVQQLKSELARELSERAAGAIRAATIRSRRAAMTRLRRRRQRVEEEEGVWATIGAALAGALMGLLVLAGGRKPDDTPAA